jgi:cell division inhibitor SulA
MVQSTYSRYCHELKHQSPSNSQTKSTTKQTTETTTTTSFQSMTVSYSFEEPVHCLTFTVTIRFIISYLTIFGIDLFELGI